MGEGGWVLDSANECFEEETFQSTASEGDRPHLAFARRARGGMNLIDLRPGEEVTMTQESSC